MIISNCLCTDLIGTVVAFVAITIVYYKWRYQYWRKKNLPYLEPTIPLGNARNAFEIQKHYEEMKAKGWKHGGLFAFARPLYLLVDLEYVKNIMSKDFNHFVDRGIYYNEKADPMSGNLFFIGGQKWRNLRRKITPTFTSGKMKMMFQILLNCTPNLLNKIEADRMTNTPINIKDVLACFTTDIIGSCAFGLELNSFKDETSSFRHYGRKLVTPTKLRTAKIVFASNFTSLAKALNMSLIPTDISNFFKNAVKDTVSYREKNNYSRKDFIQLLIDLKNNKLAAEEGYKHDGETLTMDELMAQCFGFFIAGFETSSSTMTFALYELARNLDLQQKVRNEIEIVLAKHDGEITYEAIQEMKYLDQVFNETLRKYPPLPVITRKSVSDYKIPDQDIVLDKGTDILIPVLAIHYDKEYYPDPEKFDPDRFTEENINKRPHYAHIPFGEGPRVCIGLRFGLMQSKVGLTCLLKNYKFTVNRKTQDPLKLTTTFVLLTTKDGIWLDAEKI